MAQPLIKFFHVATRPNEGEVGALYFVSGEGVLYVCTSETSFEAYAGIKTAVLNGSILTLTPSVGSAVSVDIAALAKAAVDLSDYAKTADVNTAIANAIAAEVTRANGAYDEKGAAAAAQAAAIADAAGKYQVKGDYEAAGSAEQALADAKKYADETFQVKGNYETAGAAAQALTDAKAYVDGKVDGKFDAAGSAADAQAAAEAKAAELAAAAETNTKAWVADQKYVTAAIIDGLATTEYVDGKVSAEETRAKGVEEGLQNQINLIMNNPGTKDVIDSIQEFTDYIAQHGEIAEGFRTDIDKNKEDIAAIANDYLTSTDKTELTGAIATAKVEAIDAAASNAATAITKALGKLDAAVTSTDGNKVTVKVTETDGVITAVNVTESDIASAQDLSDLVKVVEDNEHTTAAAVNELNERINNLPTEVGVMSVTKGTDGKFVTTTIGGDDARPTISVAVDYVDGSETSGAHLTTDTYVGEAIAAAVAAKNVDAEGDDLVSASAANNKVTVAASQDLKDAVSAANSAVQSVKSKDSTLQVTQEGTTVNVELAWQSF